MDSIDVVLPSGPAVVCAWCQSMIRPGTGHRVSHGICRPCAAAMRNELATIDPTNPPTPLRPTIPLPPALN